MFEQVFLYRCPLCFSVKAYTYTQKEDFNYIVCTNLVLERNNKDERIVPCYGIMSLIKDDKEIEFEVKL